MKGRVWTRGRLVLAAAFTILFLVILFRWSRSFYFRFPDGYVWGELLINYQGGFVRRGLIGEILFQLHPYVSADLVLSVVFGVLNAIVIVAVVFLICRSFDWPGLAYLLAPTGLAFPFYDMAAFNRRDILFAAGFLLCAAIVSKVSRPWVAYLFVSLVYGVLGMTQEVAWFYLPFALALLLQMTGRDLPSRDVLLMGALTIGQMAAGLALMLAFRGNPGQAEAIVASWRSVVPEAFENLGGVEFISQTIQEVWKMVTGNLLKPGTLTGFLLGALLTAVPVALYARKAMPRLRTDRLRVLAIVLAVVSFLLPLPLSLDAGRVIYLLFLHIFIMAAVLRGPEPAPVVRAPVWQSVLMTILVLLYASTWQLRHATHGGDNPLIPGALVTAVFR